jgi:hypothetical protein
MLLLYPFTHPSQEKEHLVLALSKSSQTHHPLTSSTLIHGVLSGVKMILVGTLHKGLETTHILCALQACTQSTIISQQQKFTIFHQVGELSRECAGCGRFCVSSRLQVSEPKRTTHPPILTVQAVNHEVICRCLMDSSHRYGRTSNILHAVMSYSTAAGTDSRNDDEFRNDGISPFERDEWDTKQHTGMMAPSSMMGGTSMGGRRNR